MYLPLIAIFIAISGSMGISYMAQDSLPGEPLYAVKVHINDNVKRITSSGMSGDSASGDLGTQASSSDSVYLQADPGDTDSSDTENDNAAAAVNVNASTSLDANKVINAK